MTQSSVVTSVFLVFAAGCGGPLRIGPPIPAGMEGLRGAVDAEGQRSNATTSPPGADAAAAVEGALKVRGEVLAPDEIWTWSDQIEELRRRARTSSPDQFRRWVMQRSVSLITDRITESLLYQKASAKLGDDSDERIQAYVDGEIRSIVTEQYDGIQRRFEKALEGRGQTLGDVRERLRRRALVGAYLESAVRSRVPEPTRAELYEQFQRQREQMRSSGRRSMSLIDVRIHRFLPDGVASPTREQSDRARRLAREEALTAAKELRNGADFADVARRRSHGLHAPDGGRWGPISADAVRERFLPAVQALEKLDAGEVGDPIETPDGFFIVRCDELEEVQEPHFVELQPALHQRIVQDRYNRAIGEEVARLRSEADIQEEQLAAFHRRVVQSAMAHVDQDPS